MRRLLRGVLPELRGRGLHELPEHLPGAVRGLPGHARLPDGLRSVHGLRVRLRELWAERGRIRVGIQPGGGEVQRHRPRGARALGRGRGRGGGALRRLQRLSLAADARRGRELEQDLLRGRRYRRRRLYVRLRREAVSAQRLGVQGLGRRFAGKRGRLPADGGRGRAALRRGDGAGGHKQALRRPAHEVFPRRGGEELRAAGAGHRQRRLCARRGHGRGAERLVGGHGRRARHL